jgi:hypothetical protein
LDSISLGKRRFKNNTRLQSKSWRSAIILLYSRKN